MKDLQIEVRNTQLPFCIRKLTSYLCLKSKITKILNPEENSKRKVSNQMAKSNDKTHQTNGQQLSYSWLGIGNFKYRKWWIEPGFIALNLSLVWQSHHIRIYIIFTTMRVDTYFNCTRHHLVCIKIHLWLGYTNTLAWTSPFGNKILASFVVTVLLCWMYKHTSTSVQKLNLKYNTLRGRTQYNIQPYKHQVKTLMRSHILLVWDKI